MRHIFTFILLLLVFKGTTQTSTPELYIINSESLIKDSAGNVVRPGKAWYLYKHKKCFFEKSGENQYVLKKRTENSVLPNATVGAPLPKVSRPIKCLEVVDSLGKPLTYEYYSKLMLNSGYYLYPMINEDGTASKFNLLAPQPITSNKSGFKQAGTPVKQSIRAAILTIDENCNEMDFREAAEEVKNSGGKLRLVPIEFDEDLRPLKFLFANVPAQEVKLFSPKNDSTGAANSRENATGLIDKTKQYENIKLKDLEFTDINGVKFTEAMLKDKIVVVNFWFKNCKPCLDELPQLNRMVAEFGERKDIVFIAFNVRDDKETIQNFLLSNAYNYQQADASFGEPISVKYAVDSYPTNLLIDKQGKVVYAGITSMSVGEIKNRIKGL